MNSIKLMTVFLSAAFLCLSCQNDKLLGKWKRHGDKLAGMTIQVTKEGESFKAAIVIAPDNGLGFAKGDIKWKNIKNTDGNKYEFEDLVKDGRGESNYDLSYLELISDDEIWTRGFSKGNEEVGTEQKWKRAPEK